MNQFIAWAMFAIAAGGVVAQVAISIAMGKRDREESEDTRKDIADLYDKHTRLSREVGYLKGSLGEPNGGNG